MILNPNGQPAKKTTERTLKPMLVERLIELEGLLREEGISLYCVKCQRLGLPDGITGDNRPESDIYRLSCSCATRLHHKRTGHLKVALQ